MKKGFLLVLLAVMAVGTGAGAAFGLDIGGGAVGGFYVNESTYDEFFDNNNYGTIELKNDNTFVGAFFFADFRFCLLEVSYLRLMNHVSNEMDGYQGGYYGHWGNSAEGSGNAIEIAYYLKYPIQFWRMRVFPMLGVSYIWVMSMSEEGQKLDKPKDFSSLGFLGGLGLDFALGERLFIRGEGLFNLRMPTMAQRTLYEGTDAGVHPSKGFVLKLGLGYAL